MSSDEEICSMEVHSTMPKDRLRKLTKPLMEKRRRARINSCLNQLKNLVLEAMNQNTSHFSKLEKADILEMTVKHLSQLQRRQADSQRQLDGCALARFRAGYTECAQEVVRCLSSVEEADSQMSKRVMEHLAKRIHVPAEPQLCRPHFLPGAHNKAVTRLSPSPALYLPVMSPVKAATHTTLYGHIRLSSQIASNLKEAADVKPVLPDSSTDSRFCIGSSKFSGLPVDLNPKDCSSRKIPLVSRHLSTNASPRDDRDQQDDVWRPW